LVFGIFIFAFSVVERVGVGDGRRAPVAGRVVAPVTAAERFGSSTVVKIPVEPERDRVHRIMQRPPIQIHAPRSRPPAGSPYVVRPRGTERTPLRRWRLDA